MRKHLCSCCIPGKRKHERTSSSITPVATNTAVITASSTTINTTRSGVIVAPVTKIHLQEMKSQLNLVIIMGSAREGRMCQRVTQLVQRIIQSYEISVTILDPMEPKLEIIGQPLHFRADPSAAPEVLLRTDEIIRKADGFVFISPEYNRCVGPALLNLTNHFPPTSYAHRPVAIITYSMGPQGGAMAAAQLRAHVGELGLLSIGRMVMIALVNTVVEEGGVTKDEKLTGQLSKQMEHLIWYATALKSYKSDVPVPL